MPNPVTFVNIGGNHADQPWGAGIIELAKSLHQSGVPVTLAVENSDSITAERMMRHRAQEVAELLIHKDPSLIQGSYEESIQRVASEHCKVELKEVKPYFPEPGKLDNTWKQNMPDWLKRIGAYEQELELYKFAVENKIDVCGLESESGRKNVDLSNVTESEGPRIQGMTNNGLKLIDEQLKKGGGVIITVDLGQAHCATLSRALASKVGENAQKNEEWKEVRVANLYSGSPSMREGMSWLAGSASKLGDEEDFYSHIAEVAYCHLEEGVALEEAKQLYETNQPIVENLTPKVEQLELELKESNEALVKEKRNRDDLYKQVIKIELEDPQYDEVMEQYDQADQKVNELSNKIRKVEVELNGYSNDGLRDELSEAQTNVKKASRQIKHLERFEPVSGYLVKESQVKANEIPQQLDWLKQRHSIDLKQEIEVHKPSIKDSLSKKEEVSQDVRQQREEKKKSLGLSTESTHQEGRKRSYTV